MCQYTIICDYLLVIILFDILKQKFKERITKIFKILKLNYRLSFLFR